MTADMICLICHKPIGIGETVYYLDNHKGGHPVCGYCAHHTGDALAGETPLRFKDENDEQPVKEQP